MVNMLQMRDGPLLREDAVLLALALESNGHTMSVRNGALEVTNAKQLTQAQRQQIYVCRRHLMALMDYAQHAPEPR